MPTILHDLLSVALRLEGVTQFRAGMRAAGGATSQFADEIEAANRRLEGIRTAGANAGIAAVALAAGFGKAVQIAGKMQSVEIGFTTLLGSVEVARAKIEEFREFDRKSPFSFLETTDAAKTLLAMGVEADQLIPTMTALGNAISASGGGTAEFKSASVQLAQLAQASKLTKEQVQDLTYHGIPLTEVLKEMGTTLEDVGKSGKTGADFMAAFIKVMTRGRFGTAMQDQAKILTGSLSSLGSAADQLAGSLGTPLLGGLTQTARWLTRVIDAANNGSPVVKGFATVLGVGLTGALIAVWSWTKLNEIRAGFYIKKLYELSAAQATAAGTAQALAAAQKNVAVATAVAAGTSTAGAATAGAGTAYTVAATTGAAATAGGAMAAAAAKPSLWLVAGRALGAAAGVALVAELGREAWWKIILPNVPEQGREAAKFIGKGGADVAADVWRLLMPGEKKGEEKTDAQKMLAAQEKTNSTLDEMLKAIKRGGDLPVDTGDLPGSAQLLALELAKTLR